MSEIKNFDTGIPIKSGAKIINLDPEENILNKNLIREALISGGGEENKLSMAMGLKDEYLPTLNRDQRRSLKKNKLLTWNYLAS